MKMTNRNRQAALAWWGSLSTDQHTKLISYHWPSSPAIGIVRSSSKIERMWQLEGNIKPLTDIKRINDE